MAQEYPGILLCMAAVLRSMGGCLILKHKKEHFGNEEVLRDWSQLVKTLLQWERWLKVHQWRNNTSKRQNKNTST